LTQLLLVVYDLLHIKESNQNHKL